MPPRYNGGMVAASSITSVRKRDGRIDDFDPNKIAAAIGKAFVARGHVEPGVPQALAEEVVERLESRFAGATPHVEDVQDAVEEVLMGAGHGAVAKAYILYRKKRSEIREAKRIIGVQDELKLSVNATKVLERRYLLRDEDGRLKETPAEMFRRVARSVAAVEAKWGGDATATEASFYEAMSRLQFLPNSPTLMNAGTALGQLSACFVIPVEDSMESIFDAVRDMALIHQSGGGTGFGFSHLRPKGDSVKSTQGIASGPVSFMRVFDTATDVIKQGGKRRGANMGILRVDHPDILEFVESKARDGGLTNFNISVAITDPFMAAVENDEEYPLVNPRSGRKVHRLSARHLFNLIATSAWKTGDPGLVFIDEVNRHNPTPELGAFETTNPCGELPLLPFESCNLGSINLSRLVRDGDVDWGRLGELVRLGVRFLDDVIEANKYPLEEVSGITLANRKIGLGLMGFADALFLLSIAYDSDEALALAERLMGFLRDTAVDASEMLAAERGAFPNFERSIFAGQRTRRNATVTSIAPTGTISIIAGCSSGIEPLFALSYVRSVMDGVQMFETNQHFERIAHERNFYSDDLLTTIARTGSVQGTEAVPEDLRRVFVTDIDISPEWHVRMQAAFQRHCDNAVSKTVNLPRDATVNDVADAYRLAYRLKCKGITVFRDGSKGQQVLYRTGDAPITGDGQYVSAASEYAGGCPDPAQTGVLRPTQAPLGGCSSQTPRLNLWGGF